jgi:hypothetical protein
MKFDKVKMPEEIFVFTNGAKKFLIALGEITDDNGFLEQTAEMWFYDANKLPSDFPKFFNDLLPFLEKKADGRTLSKEEEPDQEKAVFDLAIGKKQ